MRAKILRAFAYSHDGLNLETLSAGSDRDIHDALARGLIAKGLIERASAPKPAAQPVPKSEQKPAEEKSAEDNQNAGAEDGQGDGAAEIKHLGRGRYAIFREGERVTQPMTRDEALAALTALAVEPSETRKELG